MSRKIEHKVKRWNKLLQKSFLTSIFSKNFSKKKFRRISNFNEIPRQPFKRPIQSKLVKNFSNNIVQILSSTEASFFQFLNKKKICDIYRKKVFEWHHIAIKVLLSKSILQRDMTHKCKFNLSSCFSREKNFQRKFLWKLNFRFSTNFVWLLCLVCAWKTFRGVGFLWKFN